MILYYIIAVLVLAVIYLVIRVRDISKSLIYTKEEIARVKFLREDNDQTLYKWARDMRNEFNLLLTTLGLEYVEEQEVPENGYDNIPAKYVLDKDAKNGVGIIPIIKEDIHEIENIILAMKEKPKRAKKTK